MVYDDVRVRQELAHRLVGRPLCWAHHYGVAGSPVLRIESISANGMVTVAGYVGEFAPHLFTVVEAPPAS